MLKQILI